MYEEKGYHNTTVDEIAARAGVSTGIAYRYFRNKKDLLLSAVSYGADRISADTRTDELHIPSEPCGVPAYLEEVLAIFEKYHIRYRRIHEELEGLQHTDDDVRRLYAEITRSKLETLTEYMRKMFGDDVHLREKVYAAIGIMEQHCHMYMKNDLYSLDMDIMRKMTIKAVMQVLTDG